MLCTLYMDLFYWWANVHAIDVNRRYSIYSGFEPLQYNTVTLPWLQLWVVASNITYKRSNLHGGIFHFPRKQEHINFNLLREKIRRLTHFFFFLFFFFFLKNQFTTLQSSQMWFHSKPVVGVGGKIYCKTVIYFFNDGKEKSRFTNTIFR
jgi:hypothetical protein